MHINKKKFEQFHMKIVSFEYQPLVVSIPVFQPAKGLYPIIGNADITSKKMELVAEFRSKLDISNFMAEIISHKENLIDIDDGYLYHCYFVGSSTPVNEFWQGWYRLTIPFLVIQTGYICKIALRGGKNRLNIGGNWETSCIYEILPSKDIDILNIAGNKIRGLKANKRFVIDGMLKKVFTDTDQNRYGDCIFVNNKFPSLNPGNQIIDIDSSSVRIKLLYYPLFI